MVNTFKNIKNKLSACFIEKENKRLLKMLRIENIFLSLISISLLVPPVFITGWLGGYLLVKILDFLFQIELFADINQFFFYSIFWNIPLLVTSFIFFEKEDQNFNLFKIIKSRDYEKLTKILEEDIKKDRREQSNYELIDILYETKIDSKTLNLFNNEINEKISKEDLEFVLEDRELINIMNKHKNITISYGYLFKLLEKLETKNKNKNIVKFQKDVLIKRS